MLLCAGGFSGRYVAGAVTFPVRRIKVDHEAPKGPKGQKPLRLSVSPLERQGA